MRYILMSLLAFTLHVQATACDVCGGAGGSYLGIMPRFDQHFAGLSFQYQPFRATHPVMAGETEPVHTQNYVRSVTAWGRFYPLKRLQVFAFVPYTFNTSVEPARAVQMQGLGDVRVLINYMLVNKADSGGRIAHTLLAGGGVKAPTGRNDFVNSEGLILSNMQPGTGSWDVNANVNYTIRVANTGVNADVQYRHSGVNARDYRYGDKLNAALTAFYWYDIQKISLLPQGGFRYEWSAVDLSSDHYRIRNTYSGGYQAYATAGFSFYWGKLGLSSLLSIPVAENYAGGLVRAGLRTETQIQLLF